MTGRPQYGIPAAGDGYLRASTADRERAVDVLKAGFAEGRLTKDEYDARADRAFAARTLADLAAVTADLPGGRAAGLASPGAAARTSPLAVAALACGLAQPFTGCLSTIPAIVLGHIARRELRRTGEQGMGMATAGLVLGWIGACVLVLFIGVIVVAITALRLGS